MPGLGSILGAFGTAYPQYQQQQQDHQMKQLQLRQAIQQMQQAQQTRVSQQQALKGLATTQGVGPGGTITPQQLAALTNNPEAFASLNSVVRPANSGLFGLQGRDITGQYGLQGRATTGDYGLQREQARSDAMENVAGQRAKSAEAVQGLRNTGAEETQKLRNQGSAATQTIRNQKPMAASATSTGVRSASNPINTPEYRTAKSEYEEAKRDERNIEAHYPLISQAYNDPQWLDARKRSLAAQTKLESVVKEATQQAPAAQTLPPEAAKQLQEGTVTTFGNGQKWTLQNGQPKQVE